MLNPLNQELNLWEFVDGIATSSHNRQVDDPVSLYFISPL